METKVNENGKASVASSVQLDKTPKFVAGNPVNAVAKKEEQKEETDLQVIAATKAEPIKLEINTQLSGQKTELNLAQILKKIKELNRFSIQREKLIGTIDKLEDFEIAQLDEAEETNLNHFQRCELRIMDDNGNVFITKNPFIIDRVSKNIKTLCADKLTEVEAQISFNL